MQESEGFLFVGFGTKKLSVPGVHDFFVPKAADKKTS